MRNPVCVSNLDPQVHEKLKDRAKKQSDKLCRKVTISDLINEGSVLILQHYDDEEAAEKLKGKLDPTAATQALEAVNA